MLIRTIHLDDAERFLQLCLQLDQEKKFILLEPGNGIEVHSSVFIASSQQVRYNVLNMCK